MGKKKLKKFVEIEQLDCVLQYPREKLINDGFPHKDGWKSHIFNNENPIILELGCGKGEYTVGLARSNPEKNYIGIDIKGARIWKGAKEVEKEDLKNAKFLRTEIENIESFFGEGEVEEIWITFPDPQMQKPRKRLTSTRFLQHYAAFLKADGVIHLKTDSPFLFEYTRRLALKNKFDILEITDDLYGSGKANPEKSIKTFYESQWISRGKSIKLISFSMKGLKSLEEPETDDIPRDDYRAFSHYVPQD